MDNNIISYPFLYAFPQVKAFTTIKKTTGEENRPHYTGKPELRVWESRKVLSEVLQIETWQFVFPRQTHTNRVACLANFPSEELKETDALVTNQPGICLCVQTADCVPVLLFDPVNNAIGAVHAGWRGTVSLIAREAVYMLKRQFSSDEKNIRVIIGPSIGPENYEVGNEVVEAVLNNIPDPGYSLKLQPSGRFHLDLWEANRQVLLHCGLLPENIHVSGYCTFSQKELFFSARREGFETGRLVSGIMLFN